MKALTHALHIPSTSNPKLGISHMRLVTAGAKAILQRQNEGWNVLISNAKAHRSAEGEDKAFVHICHTHMWDEQSLKYKKLMFEKSCIGRAEQP